MKIITAIAFFAVALFSVDVSAQIQSHPPQALPSADKLEHDRKESWTFVKPDLHLEQVTAILIEPTQVYHGPDAQFDDIPIADREKYAELFTEALHSEMEKSFQIVSKPGANTVRLQMSIIGANRTVEGVGTAPSFMPLGIGANALKSVSGKKATYSGSVLLATEMYDSQTGELLIAAVRRVAPDALDLQSTLSTTDTVRAVAATSARKVRERLDEAKLRHP